MNAARSRWFGKYQYRSATRQPVKDQVLLDTVLVSKNRFNRYYR